MAIDFSKYAVGNSTQRNNTGSKITGSQIDFSQYQVSDYTGSQPSQQVTQIYQPPQEDNRNIFQKARDKAQGFFQDFGYNQQQGTDIVTRGKQVVKKVGDWAFGSDQEVVQLQKQDLQEKLISKKSEGKNTKEEESQLQMIYKIEDPKTDASTRKQLQQYIRLARFGQSIQSSIGTFFSTLLGISQQQEESLASSQADLYSKLYNKTDDSKPIKQYYKEEKEYWEGVRDGTKQTRTKDSIDIINKWVDDVDVAYPTNAEKVANAGGSMLVFATASVASGGSAQLPLIMEAMGEAGAVYTELRDRGKSVEESSNRANTNFVANIIVGQFLNIFEDLGADKSIKAIIKGIGTEGAQEGSQQILSNLATDRPVGEGVLESAIIGGILGGSAVLVFPSTAQNTGISADPETFIDELIATDYAKTAEGKQFMKIALQAKNQGRSLLLNITEDGKTEVTIGEVRQVQPTEVTGQAQEEAPRREKISVTDKYDGAKSAYAIIRPDGTGAISVILDKSAQGKGLGSEIVADLESQLAQKGVTKVELSAFGESVGFWQKQGYTVAESKGGLNQPMTKTLEPRKSGVQSVSADLVESGLPKEFQKKINKKTAKIKQLEKDIKAGDDLPPIPVYERDGKYYTNKDGDNRLIAYKNLGVKTIPVNIQEKTTLTGTQKQAEERANAKKNQTAKGVSERSQGARAKRSTAKKRAEAQARADKIKEYIESKKTTKFREDDINTIKDLEESAVTSKFLEDPQVKGREFASYSFLDNLSRSNKLGLKPKEQAIIKRVLDQHFLNQKKIDMKEFRRLVIGELMPIETIKSSTYADYGSDNININADNTTTYILNTPYRHGQTGHFSMDLGKKIIPSEELEIREIPAQEGNPRAKWAVIQKGVQLTEQNIEENVFTVATSKEEAQKWIDERSEVISKVNQSGLFSHYRSFDVDNIAHVAEVQSDVFQNLERVDESLDLQKRLKLNEDSLVQDKQYLAQQEQQLERAIARREAEVNAETVQDVERFTDSVKRAKEAIRDTERNIEVFKQRIENVSKDKSKEASQFLDYKNIWHERTVREAIRTKALEGFEKLRFPTPRTIAFIEGYTSEDGGMPYEIIEGDQDQLKPGDTIDYGGEEMTVVEADNYQITVAPSDKVNSFSNQQFIEEGINAQWEDVKYNIDGYTEVFGEIDSKEKVEDIKKAVEVLDKIARFNHKEAKIKSLQDAFKVSFEDMYADVSKNIENRIEKFREFETALKDGSFVEKTDVSYEGIFYGTQKQWIEDKYGLESGWVRRNQTGELISKEAQNDPKEFRKVLAKQLVEGIPETIKSEEYVLEQHKKRLETERKNYDNLIDEEQKRKMPTKKEMDVLKRFPKSSQEIIDELGNLSQYGLDYDVQEMFDWMDDNGNYSIDDYEEHWFDETSENYEPDYDGIYQEVYYDEGYGGNDTTVYGVDGYAETFQQPDEYEPGAGIEDFNIEDFDSTQQVVLRFYEKQLNKYIKKLRKGNLELVEDENGFEWWETEVRPEDKEATVAFRLKDDLADVGINITDAQEQELIKLNREIFGDDNIKITSQILANNKALGAYSQKMIEIMSKQANPKDTFFHEAVHKYIDVFTTKDEQFSLFEEGMKRYRTEDLALVEEKIAEDFIKYANNARSIKGIIARFFKKIFSRIRAFNKNASKIEKLYEEILSGKAKETVAGQTKASKVAVSIEQNLNERFENLAGFETRTVKSQAEMVSKLIAKDIEQVKKIVTGAEPLPAGMSGSMFIAGVEKYATDNNDIDLIRSLAISPLVSETSVNAQELRFLAERDKTSVLAQVQELASERAKIFKSKHKNTTPEKAIKQEVKKIKKSTNKVSKYDWNEFINSIEC